MSSLNPDPEPRAIPPAIRRELQDELDLLLAQEPEPITTDRQEHAALRRLRAEAAAGGATPVHGEIQRFRPGQPIDYANEDVLDQTTRPVALAPRARLALMGAAALLIVGVLALTTVGAAPRARAPVAPAAAAPTAAPTVTPEPLGAIRIGGASLPPVYPNALGVGERQWAVTVAPVDKGAWRVAQAANTANWLPGSVVNWSFGLWDDAARSNAAVFARLGPDSTATLWLSSGAVRTVPARRRGVGPAAADYRARPARAGPDDRAARRRPGRAPRRGARRRDGRRGGRRAGGGRLARATLTHPRAGAGDDQGPCRAAAQRPYPKERHHDDLTGSVRGGGPGAG